jgi:proteasome lid subunit RPN8/RPN11
MDAERHPWVRGHLTVPREVLDELEAEAKAAYGRDEEACGYLTGSAAEPLAADQAVIMPNLANRYHELDPEAYPRKANKYFLLDARKFSRAIEQGEAAGRPVKVLWHSHLDVGSYFSETDAAAANMGGDEPANDLAYLVTSVRQGVVDDHRLFVWSESERRYVEAPLAISPRRAG